MNTGFVAPKRVAGRLLTRKCARPSGLSQMATHNCLHRLPVPNTSPCAFWKELLVACFGRKPNVVNYAVLGKERGRCGCLCLTGASLR